MEGETQPWWLGMGPASRDSGPKKNNAVFGSHGLYVVGSFALKQAYAMENHFEALFASFPTQMAASMNLCMGQLQPKTALNDLQWPLFQIFVHLCTV